MRLLLVAAISVGLTGSLCAQTASSFKLQTQVAVDNNNSPLRLAALKNADETFTLYFAAASGTSITTTSVGAAHAANSQVTTSTSAGTVAIARPTRRSVTFTNLDGAITVWVGITGVTTSNGMRLLPGQSIEKTSVVLWQVIADSGTPKVAVLDEYD